MPDRAWELLTYKVGAGPTTPVAGPITPPSGSTTYTITATDAVGNTSTTTVTTKVDITAPTISSSVSALHSGNGWTSGGTTLTVRPRTHNRAWLP